MTLGRAESVGGGPMVMPVFPVMVGGVILGFAFGAAAGAGLVLGTRIIFFGKENLGLGTGFWGEAARRRFARAMNFLSERLRGFSLSARRHTAMACSS